MWIKQKEYGEIYFTSGTLAVVAQSHEPGTHVYSVWQVKTKLINPYEEAKKATCL